MEPYNSLLVYLMLQGAFEPIVARAGKEADKAMEQLVHFLAYFVGCPLAKAREEDAALEGEDKDDRTELEGEKAKQMVSFDMPGVQQHINAYNTHVLSVTAQLIATQDRQDLKDLAISDTMTTSTVHLSLRPLIPRSEEVEQKVAESWFATATFTTWMARVEKWLGVTSSSPTETPSLPLFDTDAAQKAYKAYLPDLYTTFGRDRRRRRREDQADGVDIRLASLLERHGCRLGEVRQSALAFATFLRGWCLMLHDLDHPAAGSSRAGLVRLRRLSESLVVAWRGIVMRVGGS